MSSKPTLVFVPGAWHKPICYQKVIKPLEEDYHIRCVPVTLPSTTNNPEATFKDDIDATRAAITSETSQGRNVIVIVHSYSGLVGSSAVKGLTKPTPPQLNTGYVVGLVLIATGYNFTGLAFMDPFLGLPVPFFRANKATGYADLTADPRDFFYHDVPDDEAQYWVSQLTRQSLKALYEGGKHAYAGWRDVPTWYVGTIEDRGLPIVVQRLQVGFARDQGAVVHHTELQSSHSPFLSMPEEVVAVLLNAVRSVSGEGEQVESTKELDKKRRRDLRRTPMVLLGSPGTWFKYGIPFFMGRVVSWGFSGFMSIRSLMKGR